MGDSVLCLRYIDDILVVVPKDMNLDEKLVGLNSVEDKIQFTLGKENNGASI